ncbi:MAG: fibrobacter succinogenes major paralogous domain-containing protein [Bacteroidota bacterium]|nr:fibrobacter succinogenes major paralogous domain-containing protein [Bacteroidota bacterium]
MYAQLKDVDGNEYDTVKIGTQVWMAENLDVSRFRNGDPITEAETREQWDEAAKEGKPAWCYYHRDSDRVTIYNKLYNWYAVNDPRGLAPAGWRIPTKQDWATLINNSGGDNKSGIQMKSSTEWDGAHSNGLNCLPGGYRNREGDFEHAGKIGSWWTATQNGPEDAWSVSLGTGTPAASTSFDTKEIGLSVICVKDQMQAP